MEKKASLMKPKHQCLLSQWEEWVYSAQSWKERRLVCESMFAQNEKWTFALKNWLKEKLFLWNQNINVIYPNEENKIIVLNHEIKMKLPCEFVFAPIEKWTLIPKNGGKRSFFYKAKAPMSFMPMRGMSLWCPITKRKVITIWICVCPN